jgi:hypothetical protein
MIKILISTFFIIIHFKSYFFGVVMSCTLEKTIKNKKIYISIINLKNNSIKDMFFKQISSVKCS